MCFDRVLGGPIKCFDPQVLLDPFEEELDLPAAFVELSNHLRGEREVVGQKDQTLVRFGIEITDASQFVGVAFQRVETCDGNDLVDSYPCRFVHRLGVQAFENEVALRPSHKECLGLMNPVEAGKVYVGSIHDVDGAGFDKEFVEDIDIVNFAMCDADNNRDAAPQVQQRMELHGGFALAEFGPGENRKTEIDDRGIEGVDCPVELQSEILGCVQLSGRLNQHLSEVGINSSVSDLVGVGQGVSGDLASNPHVIELGFGHAQARLDIPQTFPVGQLRKSHAEELIPAGKALDLVIAVVAFYALTKFVRWDKVHQLSKNDSSDIHSPSPSAVMRKYDPSEKIISNTKMSLLDKNLCLSIC